MRRIERTGQFRRDYKRERKGRNRAEFDTVLIGVLKSLAEDRPLAERHRDGAVTVTGWCQLRVASSFLL